MSRSISRPAAATPAVPAVELTSAQRAVLDAVGQLGRATASVIAASVGSQSGAVGNVLAHLTSAGLLLRAEGAGRIGHTYVHPRLVDASSSAEPLTTAVDIPDALSEEIAAIASMAGRQPGDLLTEAWREFLDRDSRPRTDAVDNGVLGGRLARGVDPSRTVYRPANE